MKKEINIGYARVSTVERQVLGLELQIRALKRRDVIRYFTRKSVEARMTATKC